MNLKNEIRMEGLTLTVADVKHSSDYYGALGFSLEWDASPAFAMLRMGGPNGTTLGLLAHAEAAKEGTKKIGDLEARGIHVELSTDNLDGLYEELIGRGVTIDVPPHDEPWERSMTALDPDGYSVEFSEGRRGKS